MVEVSAARPGNCFQCPRCGSEATYYFDSPFCAITGDSLAYLAYCPRCGQVKYSSPLLSVDLGCPTCLGELVLTTIWDTPQRTDPGRYSCPQRLELAESGLRPTNRRGRNAASKVWRADRRLFELRIHLGRFGQDPRHAQANRRQAELQQVDGANGSRRP